MTTSKHIGFKGLLFAATILPGPLMLAAPIPAVAQIGVVVSVQLAPPVLPIYVQPPLPEVGYVWTPGYWQWDATTGYYWVPGTWVLPPTVGVLWTPPYWGWSNGLYVFHGGYWGPHVGFYGGVNYGYGYGGVGYEGGRWEGGRFAYNQSVNNFGSVHIDNGYRQNVTVISNTHVSFNGGPDGVRAEPTAAEREAEHENHVPATADQTRHITAAAHDPSLAAKNNNGQPAIAATARPGEFTGAGAVRPQAAGAHAEVANPAGARPAQVQAAHPAVTSAAESHAAPHQVAAPRAAPAHIAAPAHVRAPVHAAAVAPVHAMAPARAAAPRAAAPRAAPHAAPAREEKR
jgi:hypothetical protein